MQNGTLQSWYPDAPDQEGVWCDAEVIAGSDSSMATAKIEHDADIAIEEGE